MKLRAQRMAAAPPSVKTDRQLIDEAIRAGRVTKLPLGYAVAPATPDWSTAKIKSGGDEG